MDIDAPKIKSLREWVKAVQQEAELAITFHELWKPAAHDEELHARMGVSYATNAFHVVRDALRREALLALMRLWDWHPRAVGLQRIAETLGESDVIDALAAERATNIRIRGAGPSIREALEQKARSVVEIIAKYSEGGTHFEVRERLRTLRNERLAHHQMVPSTSAPWTRMDEEVETFYHDMLEAIRLLLSFVEAKAYDLADMAGIYKFYASQFWAATRGERTEGHPNYRPPLTNATVT